MYDTNVLVPHHTNSNAHIIRGSYIIYFKILWLYSLNVNNSRYTSYLMVSYKQNICKQKVSTAICITTLHENHWQNSETRNMCTTLICKTGVSNLPKLILFYLVSKILSIKMLQFFRFQNILNCQHKKKSIYNFETKEKGRCNYTLLKEHFTGLLQCNNSQAYYTKISRET